MLTIDVIDKTHSLDLSSHELARGILRLAAAYLKVELPAEVSVTFTDNAHIQSINKTYRGKDQPTDVISFALEETGEDEIALKQNNFTPRLLGDIIISVEKTEEQAKRYGHAFVRELGFLIVHGFLHLLGYDHMTEEEEKTMFKLQEEVLEAYGLSR